jgi:hypothetical protein
VNSRAEHRLTASGDELLREICGYLVTAMTGLVEN